MSQITERLAEAWRRVTDPAGASEHRTVPILAQQALRQLPPWQQTLLTTLVGVTRATQYDAPGSLITMNRRRESSIG